MRDHPCLLAGRRHPHSDLRLFDGFIIAALTDWKLTVSMAIAIVTIKTSAKISQ